MMPTAQSVVYFESTHKHNRAFTKELNSLLEKTQPIEKSNEKSFNQSRNRLIKVKFIL